VEWFFTVCAGFWGWIEGGFGWVMDTSVFVPRANCGDWPTWLIEITTLSNTIVAFAYMVIPLGLLDFWRWNWGYKEARNLLLCFSLFIVLCGWTHANEVLVFWWPAYRFFALITLLTALASLATAYLLPMQIAFILRRESPEKLQQLLEEREKAFRAVQWEREKLEKLREEDTREFRELQRLLADQRRQIIGLKDQLVTEEMQLEMRERLHAIVNVLQVARLKKLVVQSVPPPAPELKK
jgi:hypothetical protein